MGLDVLSYALGMKKGSGEAITVEPLTATENKTYTAPTGKAYSPVTVNVSGGGGGSELLYNGTKEYSYQFDQFDCTFESTKEPNYIVVIKNDLSKISARETIGFVYATFNPSLITDSEVEFKNAMSYLITTGTSSTIKGIVASNSESSTGGRITFTKNGNTYTLSCGKFNSTTYWGSGEESVYNIRAYHIDFPTA